MVRRAVETQFANILFGGKAILVLGARQVGKSTLLRELEVRSEVKTIWLDAEEADVAPLFANPTAARLRSILGDAKLLVIDEAQKIPEIGKVLKIAADHLQDVQIIATGSSAFDLRQRSGEPLTGRKWEIHLYPFSFSELAAHNTPLDEIRLLPERLVMGSYPEIALATGDARPRLRLLSASYLYKDILLWTA